MDYDRRKALEAIVYQYSNPFIQLQVRDEVDSRRASEKRVNLILVALETTLQTHVYQMVLQNKMKDNNLSEPKKGTVKNDPLCSIQKYLNKFTQILSGGGIEEPHLHYLRYLIYKWGMGQPWTADRIEQRNSSVEQSTQTYMNGAKQPGGIPFQSTSTSVTKTESRAFDWRKLTEMNSSSELILFGTNHGKVLKGEIVGLPMVTVGLSFLVKDKSGSITQVGLYNYIQDKNMSYEYRTKYARKHLRAGTKVAIAEPFCKVFADGDRGIRIDNPLEFKVESAGLPLNEARQFGNDLARDKYLLTALNTYIDGLRTETIIPTLLSNRAQALLKLEMWPDALADAAASLTIRPSCKKTWKRYETALNKLRAFQKKNILMEIIESHDWGLPSFSNQKLGEQEAISKKEEGNIAFKNANFELARSLYSEALLLGGDDDRAVLSNWALCALGSRCQHDAIAASFASLRIWNEEKAVYRFARALAEVAEPSMALKCLEKFGSSSKSHEDLKRHLCKLEALVKDDGFSKNSTTITQRLPKYTCDWYGSIETFLHPTKGRGIRTTQALKKFDAVLIEHPLIKEEAVDHGTININSNKSIDLGSSVAIRSAILSRSCRDQRFARRVNILYDGKTAGPLKSIDEMLNFLESNPLLLPTHYEYLDGEQIVFSEERAHGIASTNCFGSKGGEEESFYNSTSRRNIEKEILDGKLDKFMGESMLLSVQSMFNHSNQPNCFYMRISADAIIVCANKCIGKGEELTIRYHDDPEVVKRQWGI